MSTLKKISEVAKCSISTVSRALNNCNDVSEETRENILRIANDLGYFQRKKQIKLENRKKNRFNIAILCPELESSYYSKMIIDITYELSKYDSNAVIYDYSFNNIQLQELLNACHNDKNIDAIVCLDSVVDIPLFDDMPMVAFRGKSHCSSFFIDYSSGIREVFESLDENNTIYIVCEDESISQEIEFTKVAKNYSNIETKRFFSSKRFEHAGYDAGEYFIKNNIFPNVIICAYDEIALGLIETLKNNNVKIPEQVSVIGINDIPTAKFCFGGLSTISYDFKSISAEMVRDLIENLRNSQNKIYSYSVPTKLIKRKT